MTQGELAPERVIRAYASVLRKAMGFGEQRNRKLI